jgi:hypothetical protein
MVVIAPLTSAVPAYRLSFSDAPLLAFGHKPPFFPCIPQDTSPLHLFAKSPQ